MYASVHSQYHHLSDPPSCSRLSVCPLPSDGSRDTVGSDYPRLAYSNEISFSYY
jgi:hypothetical protein